MTATPFNRSRWPRVVTLCGSTRFGEAFEKANLELTLQGYVVLSVGCSTHSDKDLALTPETKADLDWLHRRKINMSDRVHVLNVGGYVGESTQLEIAYALTCKGNKQLTFLEPKAGESYLKKNRRVLDKLRAELIILAQMGYP